MPTGNWYLTSTQISLSLLMVSELLFCVATQSAVKLHWSLLSRMEATNRNLRQKKLPSLFPLVQVNSDQPGHPTVKWSLFRWTYLYRAIAMWYWWPSESKTKPRLKLVLRGGWELDRSAGWGMVTAFFWVLTTGVQVLTDKSGRFLIQAATLERWQMTWLITEAWALQQILVR